MGLISRWRARRKSRRAIRRGTAVSATYDLTAGTASVTGSSPTVDPSTLVTSGGGSTFTRSGGGGGGGAVAVSGITAQQTAEAEAQRLEFIRQAESKARILTETERRRVLLAQQRGKFPTDVTHSTREFEPTTPIDFSEPPPESRVGLVEDVVVDKASVRKFRRRAKFQEAFEQVNLQPFYQTSESIVSLGGILDYNPQDISDSGLISQAPPGMGFGGTLMSVDPTFEEMTPEQRLQRQINDLRVSTKIEAARVARESTTQQEYDEKIAMLQEKFSSKAENLQTKYQETIMKQTVGLSFAKGVVVGGISAIAPPLGFGILGTSVLKGVDKGFGLKESWAISPSLTLTHIGAGFVGASVGGIATYKFAPYVKDFFRTFGREKFPTSKVISSDVMGGKAFPTSDPSKHLSIFKDSFYKLPGEKGLGVYHATPQAFSKLTRTTKGTSELPGLYTSPSLSAYFLKVGGKSYKPFSFNIKSAFTGSPTAIRITPKGITYTPAKVISGGKAVWLKPPKEGFVNVPGIKTEIEGIISPEAWLQRTKGSFYFGYLGRRIPIEEFAVVGFGGTPTTGTISATALSNLYSSSYTSSSVGAVSPSSLTGALSYSPSSIKDLTIGLPSYTAPPSTKVSPTSFAVTPPPSYKPSTKVSSRRMIPPFIPQAVSRKRGLSFSPIPYFPYRRTGRVSYTPFPRRRITFQQPGRKVKEPARKDFSVHIRRFGKFRQIGGGLTLGQAFAVGKRQTATSLGATFKITGAKMKGVPTPFGYYRKPSKQGALFIEKPKFRLSTFPETKEIQYFKSKKRRK